MLRLTKLLMTGAAVMALAACGSAEVASPGEGDFGGGGGGGGGGTTPLPPGTPAADCPAGLADVGVVGGGTLRACQLPATITGSLRLSVRAGTVYAFSGRTQVGIDRGIEPSSADGAQGILTIDPGVRIFASGGSDYLIVNRGSQIFAEGTPTQPIVFTSRQSIEGTTTDASEGQWGGVILAGRAPQANCVLSTTPGSTACTGQVEGTSAFYGGNTPSDSSGRMRYVQINFTGFALAPGNELQGLTLAGVGSGTTIDHIQVHNSADDGIEIFGGNVNLSHLVITGADDDGFDTDTGWRGGAQFGIVTQRTVHVRPDQGRGAGFEFSAAPASTPIATRYNSQPKISNFTLVGRMSDRDVHTLIHLDSGTDPTIVNTVVTAPTGSLSPCFAVTDADTFAVAPTLNSVFMSCPVSYRSNVANSEAIFTAGANNTAAGTSTLTAPAGAPLTGQLLTFINGANENAVTPTAASSVHSFFVDVPYIGAVRNSSDTWWSGWTCGLTSGSNCR